VKCDVRQWKEQLEVFKAAIANSPHKSVDIVIANAGIATEDPLYKIGRYKISYLGSSKNKKAAALIKIKTRETSLSSPILAS
jgi:NAD(P)-dependent dehydrogenase (short-subunit alcohol dehydrogenase family)